MLTANDLDCFQELSPTRSRRLFNEFLPTGYGLTTLNTVREREKVIDTKVILGAIITLYDDYADRPDRLNSRLLEILYRIPFEKIEVHQAFLSQEEKIALKLATSLFEKLSFQMQQLANYGELRELFYFDLKQFFLANQYAEQLTKKPSLRNKLENKLYLHHNMGIVMAGMIDMMSLTEIDFEDLGTAREILLQGQRAGRISNIVSTYEREQEEGDVTNELVSDVQQKCVNQSLKELVIEFENICENITNYRNCKNFSASAYADGIRDLHNLHLNLKGVI